MKANEPISEQFRGIKFYAFVYKAERKREAFVGLWIFRAEFSGGLIPALRGNKFRK